MKTTKTKIIIYCWRPQPQGINLALSLVKYGYHVTYITNQIPSMFSENYVDSIDVKIIRHSLLNNKLINLINWVMGFYLGIIIKPDIIIGIEEQGFVPAVLLKLLNKSKLLIGYFLEYLSPETTPSSFATQITKYLGRFSDAILDVEEQRLNFRKQWMAFNCPSFIVRNSVSCNQIHNKEINSHNHLNKLSIMYHGSLNPSCCTEQLMQAVDLCNIPIVLTILGRRNDYFDKLMHTYRLLFQSGKIRYVGFLERNEFIKYFHQTDLGIVFYNNPQNINETYCAPNKLYEYISYGIPIICSNNPSLTFVEKEEIGVQVYPYDINEISNLFKLFYNNKNKLIKYKLNCINLFQNKFNYEFQLNSFITWLHNISSRPFNKGTNNSNEES